MNLYQDTCQISYLNSSQSGWDSLVIHKVIIRPFQESLDIQQACFSYTWIDGVTYSESTNVPLITLTNQYGCDSIVQLNLTIDTVNTNIEVDATEIQSLAMNATYQWLDCDNDYSEIQDENSAFYQASSNGSYAVIVTQGLCTDTSNCVSIQTVGVLNNDLINIAVQPNPTIGQIYLSGLSEDMDLKKIELRNSIGELIWRWGINELNIDLSDFSNGLYFLKLFINEDEMIIKVIKQ